MKSIQTETIILTVISDDIIKIEPQPTWSGVEQLEHSKKNLDATFELSEGKMMSLLCILGKTNISKESRDFYKNTPPQVKKVAFVVKNYFQKLIGSMFIGISKLQVPTKLFSTENEALKWLKDQE